MNELKRRNKDQRVFSTIQYTRNSLFELDQPKVPDLTLYDSKGDKVQLSNLIGNGYLLLDFWATWCLPCIEELHKLNELTNKPLKLICVSIDRDFDKFEQFINQSDLHNIDFYFIGNSQYVETIFRFKTIPHKSLIGPDARILLNGVKTYEDALKPSGF